MPITPFHFGPGLLLKAAIPSQLSLSAFVLANVVIDFESAYYLLQGSAHVHRTLHTLGVAAIVGVGTGLLTFLVRKWLARRRPDIAPPFMWRASLLGGFLGGVSHSLLDGVMHPDIRPFWPLYESNPLLRATSLGTLHMFCFVAGLLGLVWLAARSRSTRASDIM